MKSKSFLKKTQTSSSQDNTCIKGRDDYEMPVAEQLLVIISC